MGPFELREPLTFGTGIGLCVLLLLVGLLLVPAQFRRGRPVRGWITQTAVLILLPAFVVLTAFLGINRTSHMFTSWADLLSGAEGGAVRGHSVGSLGAPTDTATTPGAPSTGGGGVGADPSAPDLTPLQAQPLQNPALTGLRDTADGQWITVTIPGVASDVTQNALVHLPAGYLQDPGARYPVLLAFPGVPGAPEAYRDLFKLDAVIDQLHQAGTMREAIIVVPDVYPGNADTECVDGADGTGRYETWIAQDVIGWVRTNLRATPPEQGGFATFGYSAGGWCASMLSVRHPDLVTTSISMAGYFAPEYSAGQQRRPAGDREYDLPRIMREQKPAVQLYFFSGGGDTGAREAAATMVTAIRESGAGAGMQVEASASGGHLIYLWVEQTPAALTWLAQHDPAFAPG